MKTAIKEGLSVLLKGFGIAFCLLMPSILLNEGVLTINTDFQLQQIPFGVQNHLAIQAGAVFWEPFNELGASFIGSYSFYTLGSPFYWLSLLFPPTCYPYLIGVLLMLKFAVASLTAYYYLKQFVSHPRYALWGSWLYAFSGFQLTNMLFNHFHDVTALFPLLLLALDATVLKQKRGWFAWIVGLSALLNYYFFLIEVLFLVLYFLANWVGKRYTLTWKLLGQLAFESLLGVGLAGILFLPSVLFVFGNPRLEKSFLGQLTELPEFIFFHLLYFIELARAMFLSPESMSVYSWGFTKPYASFSLWIPLIGPSFILIWLDLLKLEKWRWLRLLMIFLLIFLCFPLLALFFVFYTDFTFRWFFPFSLLLALLGALGLEQFHQAPSLKLGAVYSRWFVFALACQWVTLFRIGEAHLTAFILGFLVSLVQLLLFKGLLTRGVFHSVQKIPQLFVVTIFTILLSGWNVLSLSHSTYLEPYTFYDYGRERELKRVLTSNTNFRLDTNQIFLNRHFTFGVPATTGFNSNIQGSAFDLYHFWLGRNRKVVTCSNQADQYYFQSAMSAKYVLTYQPEITSFFKSNTPQTFHCGGSEIEYPALTFLMEEGPYRLYENPGFIPMGFTYTHYLELESFQERVDVEDRQPYLLKTLLLSREQIERYGDWLTAADLPLKVSLDQYWEDVAARNQETCDSFAYTKDGAVCQIQLSQPNLVFFSIPFDKGWKAYVNGEDVPVEQVSAGFLAVPVSHTEAATIELVYRPEGLTAGIGLSFLSLSLLTGYLMVPLFKKS